MVQVTTNSIFNCILIVIISLLLEVNTSFAQSDSFIPAQTPWFDSSQTLNQYIKEHLDEMTPPEVKKRQGIRRAFQQRGYCNVLYDILNQDGLGAFISLVKVNLQLEYSLVHKTVWIIPPDPKGRFPGIPFPEDWSFPADPWKKK